MSNLEDALRGAFGSDLFTQADELVGDIRRGAEQRRARRTTVIAAGAVAAVVAVIGIGSATLSDGDQGTPDPAPSPTPTVTDTAPKPARPGPESMAVEAVGDLVWVTVRESDCGCTVLWRHDAGGWSRLYDFPREYVERLAFAPNGLDGLAADGSKVWATHDSGRTWTNGRVPLDGDPERGDSFVVDADSQHVWAANIISGTLWRAPVGTETFERVPVDGDVWNLELLDGAIAVEPAPEGEGNTTSVPLISRDDATTWAELPFPCDGENQLLPAFRAVFALCSDGADSATVYRSTNLSTWEVFGTSTGYLSNTVPLGDDRILLTGEQDVLLTEPGPVEVDTGISENVQFASDAQIWSVAFTGAQTYLATTNGLIVSTDDGLTWGPAD